MAADLRERILAFLESPIPEMYRLVSRVLLEEVERHHGDDYNGCSMCATEDSYAWPCPTLQRIAKALSISEEGDDGR